MAILQIENHVDTKEKTSLFKLVTSSLPDAKHALRQPDIVLMQKIASGDQRAMRKVYDTHFGPLFHFVKSWLANPHEASDIVHETMLEVWKKAERFQGRSSLKSWIFAIARNKSIDKNRKLSRMTYTDEMPEVVDSEATPSQALELSQNAEHIKTCIGGLSAPYRRMIHLAFYEDLTYKEIASIENCQVGTVKTRILHAKKLLKRNLTA